MLKCAVEVLEDRVSRQLRMIECVITSVSVSAASHHASVLIKVKAVNETFARIQLCR